MNQIIDKFYNIVDKIGKRNFVLAVFILIILIVAGLYTTFSMYTEYKGVSVIDGVNTYEFVLNNNNDKNSVVITGGSSRNINIKISNLDDTTLRYGLYYSSIDSLIDVYIGYKENSSKLGVDTIGANEESVVSLKILNFSNNSVTIDFGIVYGLENGGDLVAPSGKSFVELYDGPILLSDVKVGSYVTYTGDNGCGDSSCSGTNVNYKNDAEMGYCYNQDYSYNTNGFRVGYIKNNTAYLISAGSLKCIATDEVGNMSLDSTSNYDITSGGAFHITNLNKLALTYCNKDYSYMGVCDSRSSWAMDVSDFKRITGSVLAPDSCFNKQNSECGYNNDLIDNGGYYWFASQDNSLRGSLFGWDPSSRRVNHYYSNYSLGMRPVIRLDDDVYAMSGDGSYGNPYVLGVVDDDNDDSNDSDIVSSNKSDANVLVSKYIENLYNDGSNIDDINIGNNSDIVVKLNKKQGIVYDNNGDYRYYGNNPNNYIEFNNELWRIISISNVKDSSSSTLDKIVKIIRDDATLRYSFDSSDSSVNNGNGVNDWGKSDLMMELNNLYYNGKSGDCYVGGNNKKEKCDFSEIGLNDTSRKLIIDTLYYMGNNDIKGDLKIYANGYYNIEREGTGWTGKVGIMNASDYLYASDLSLCKNTVDNYSSDVNCYNNWLFNKEGDQYVLFVDNGTSNGYVLSSSGNIEKVTEDNGYVSQARIIRPVLYLKSDVVVVSGEGTRNKPYVLK